jgi:hypothetical protein
MAAVSALIRKRVEALRLLPATGLIPAGIPGSLTRASEIKHAQLVKTINPVRFVIAVPQREFQLLNHADTLSEVRRSSGVDLILKPFETAQLRKLPFIHPDILILTFPGAFQDPEGFIPVLESFLATELKNIFRENYSIYQEALTESNWDRRAQRYQDLNRKVCESGTMVPGWRIPIFEIISNKLTSPPGEIKRAPKISEFRPRKEDL